MRTLQANLQHQKELVVDNRRVLHNSRAEPTGKALQALLEYHLNKSLRSLETASGEMVVRLQGEIFAYRTMLEYQQNPGISLQS